MLRTLCLAIGITLACALPAMAAPVSNEHVTASLLAEPSAIAAGQPFTVGVVFDLEPHWHLYWLNPGDSGLQPDLNWALPDGFTATEPDYPAPVRIDIEGLTSYGHEGRMVLLTTITPPATLTVGSTATFKLAADYLVCSEVCIPGTVNLELSLPVAESPVVDNANSMVFTDARAVLPVTSDAWTVSAWRQDDTIQLQVNPTEVSTGTVLKNLRFFAAEDGVITYSAPQKAVPEGEGYRLSLHAEGDAVDYGTALKGVLTATSGFSATGAPKALTVDLAIADAAPEGMTTATTTATGAGTTTTASTAAPIESTPSGIRNVWLAFLCAFAGGIILNLMPCVLPVLSLKVFSFVQQAGEDKRETLLHGFLFTLGVLVSFWALAGTLLVLRQAGEQIGWGFQLQSPQFLVLLCAFLFIFGLSLLGVFEIGAGLTGIAGTTQAIHGRLGSFLNGVTATLVATPCTAPFMGSALGYALSQSNGVVLLIFTFLGLGMASPYLILSASPGLLKYLPRPGAWMESFKHVMGFLIIGTIVWLAWVFGTITGPTGMAYLLGTLFFIGIAGWLVGRFAQQQPNVAVQQRAWIGAVLMVVLAVAVGFRGIASSDAPGPGVS
ncbi:MAG: protein-disulfide reductase DsbD domain-containing protein, partial [bacterium]